MSAETHQRTFIDSNILVYAHDIDETTKHPIATKLLKELFKNRSGVLSPQVLQEFYVNVTRKIKTPLSQQRAREIVEDFSVCCIATTATEVAAAFRIETEYRLSFWDALICASAIKAGAHVILSEDLSHDQKIAGIRVENPFHSTRN